ncbi:hypothetical protein L484_016808 [Morus notabilis]|uniref:Amino acid transporter transmembrane domain-containing protein n=1 Tax=Morus notabilis TaxID=981085 RepID=W9S4I4_9ROSA|nr:hypothetical protein L484_016808 [Morus notabilis]
MEITTTEKENHTNEANIQKKLDAGALFVLKSRGSWLHCGYHLTTTIVAPALLSLPFALSLLGWFAGISCLVISALVTFYSYNMLSLVLEHHAQLGWRQLRFREMATDILAFILLGGQSLKGPKLAIHIDQGIKMAQSSSSAHRGCSCALQWRGHPASGTPTCPMWRGRTGCGAGAPLKWRAHTSGSAQEDRCAALSVFLL